MKAKRHHYLPPHGDAEALLGEIVVLLRKCIKRLETDKAANLRERPSSSPAAHHEYQELAFRLFEAQALYSTRSEMERENRVKAKA